MRRRSPKIKVEGDAKKLQINKKNKRRRELEKNRREKKRTRSWRETREKERKIAVSG